MLQEIATQLKASVDPHLVDKLLEYYTKVKEYYYIGDHDKSEQNAGKFCEIAIRVIQSITKQHAIPIGEHISNFRKVALDFEALPKRGFDDSIKFLIPYVLLAVYTIRNKRGVAHVGEINPNFMDASLMVTACDWVVGELLRMYHGISIEETQRIIDGLIRRKIPIVHDIGNRKRILKSNLSYSDKALVLLAREHPEAVSDTELAKWTEHSNPTVFRKKILKKLHDGTLIDWHAGKCQILPPGIKYVEKNYNNFLMEE